MKRRPRDRVVRGRRTPASHSEQTDDLKEFVTFLAKGLVDEPGAVSVSEMAREDGLVLSLRVAQGDLGNVIGRNGRTAQAMRTLLGVRAAGEGRKVDLDIVD